MKRFFKFFGNIIKKLNISIDSKVLGDVSMIQDPIIAAIEKYKQHPSILTIRKHIRVENYFDFKYIDDKKMAEVLKEICANSNLLKKTSSYLPLFSLECLTFILTKNLFQIT